MADLYEIFRRRLAAGVSSLHPHRWLAAKFRLGFLNVLDCRFQRKSLFALAEEEGDSPVAIIGHLPIVDIDAAHRALRAIGRCNLPNVYRANARLSWDYQTHCPVGVEVQDALKDLLKERIPSLRFEVRSPAGAADAVTSKAVYEVARLKAWKQGMGQLCAYARYFPKHRPILYLFGDEMRPKELGELRGTCQRHGIRVEYMRFTSVSFGPKTVASSMLPPVSPLPEVHGCGGDESLCLVRVMTALVESRPMVPIPIQLD